MGYAILIASCYACGRSFTCNPRRVPAYQGTPVCKDCITQANTKRAEMGLSPHPVPDDAYSPIPEGAL